ncbi:Uncharacteriezd protein [Desulfonema limicola]|uniref:Uncharacteriezd protein n=1 Tax=Desulfonema limicola TaxID=45656 RepID=A0A975BBE5_9BACT|nr:hypothetical protein [Desulfonema limicola]QTA82188.1 Uncharacteriezd protein [Desulfonema limicola]
MFKRIFQIGTLVLFISMMSFPSWADNGVNQIDSKTDILARGGYGPGDGTGNGGNGPRDGSGNGSRTGDCLFPDAETVEVPAVLAKGGRGNGGGNGGGSGPRDGSGPRGADGTCVNL